MLFSHIRINAAVQFECNSIKSIIWIEVFDRCLFEKLIFAGTFAVVSLITGLVVDQSSCNDLSSSDDSFAENGTSAAYTMTSDGR